MKLFKYDYQWAPSQMDAEKTICEHPDREFIIIKGKETSLLVLDNNVVLSFTQRDGAKVLGSPIYMSSWALKQKFFIEVRMGKIFNFEPIEKYNRLCVINIGEDSLAMQFPTDQWDECLEDLGILLESRKPVEVEVYSPQFNH